MVYGHAEGAKKTFEYIEDLIWRFLRSLPWQPQWLDRHPEHNLDWGHHKEAYVKI